MIIISTDWFVYLPSSECRATILTQTLRKLLLGDLVFAIGAIWLYIWFFPIQQIFTEWFPYAGTKPYVTVTHRKQPAERLCIQAEMVAQEDRNKSLCFYLFFWKAGRISADLRHLNCTQSIMRNSFLSSFENDLVRAVGQESALVTASEWEDREGGSSGQELISADLGLLRGRWEEKAHVALRFWARCQGWWQHSKSKQWTHEDVGRKMTSACWLHWKWALRHTYGLLFGESGNEHLGHSDSLPSTCPLPQIKSTVFLFDF